MTDETKPISGTKFPAKIVDILDEYKVVINRGSSHGIAEGQRFLLYALSKGEIRDPDTKEPLGFLEIVKGTGRVTHVQEKMATLESDKIIPNEKKIVRTTHTDMPSTSTYLQPSWLTGIQPGTTIVEEETGGTPRMRAFKDPEIGDWAKPV
jgi:hypothetical protein